MQRKSQGHGVALFNISKVSRPGSEVLSLKLFHMDVSYYKDTSNSVKPKSLLLPVRQNDRS